MSAERWERIERVFFGALECDAEARAVFLREICAGDPALCDEVKAMLTAHERGRSLLLEDRLLAGDSIAITGSDALLGARIGPYRVLREIGRGGMGTVYLAERDDAQFDRQVALKVVHSDPGNAEMVRRFFVERQILAQLHHPNIAGLLDGGVTEDGSPFFVMEYVEGVPIDAYCDRHRLGVEERLALFQSVCRAVHFAHKNLVVHRDLKPANILVTADGTVKLLDFGIAKLLSDESASAPLTRTGARWMTPEYATPEQVRGERITTATDVYALGLLLYELLTGRLPYDVDGASAYEIQQAICERDPERPSLMATRTTATEVVSRARRTSPERLRRRLSGDLDMIALMALRKEPERRYASAERFLEDIKRHLAGLPVKARPDTFFYRATKFVQRHRLGATAAFLLAVSVAAGMTATIWQAQIAARERDQARHEARKAEQARLGAEEVSGFLMGLFEANDPSEARGDTVTALELLERGVGRVEELAGQPVVQARMLDVIGQVYRRLGRYREAQPLLERAVAQWRYLNEPGELARSLSHLGLLRIDQGQFAEAEMLLQEAHVLRQSLYPTPHPDLAESFHDLGGLYFEKGNYAAADTCFRAALALRESLLGEEHPLTIRTLRMLGASLSNTGWYEEAESVLHRVLEGQRRRFGDLHPDIAITLNDLALLLKMKGDRASAVVFYRESLAVRRTLYGDVHPRVGVALVNLARLLMEQDAGVEAESLLSEAVTIFRAVHGADHPDVAWTMGNLAQVYARSGDSKRAFPLYREAAAILRRTLGAGHPRLGSILTSLAILHVDLKQYDEAEALYRESLSIYRNAYGERHPDLATLHLHVGRLYHAQGRLEDAEFHLNASVALYRETVPPDHPRTASALASYGELLLDRGAAWRAEPLLREALRIYEATAGTNGRQMTVVRRALGRVLVEQGRLAEAEPFLVGGVDQAEQAAEYRTLQSEALQ